MDSTNGTPKANPLAELQAGRLPKQPPRESIVLQCVVWAGEAERRRLQGDRTAHEKLTDVLEVAHAGYGRLYGEQAAEDLKHEMDKAVKQAAQQPMIHPRTPPHIFWARVGIIFLALALLIFLTRRAWGDEIQAAAAGQSSTHNTGKQKKGSPPAKPTTEPKCVDGQVYDQRLKRCATPE